MKTMTDKHTPGPWATATVVGSAPLDEREDVGIVAGGKVIAEAFHRVGERDYMPALANACLIAAAPAMLEALKRARNDIESMLPYANIGQQHADEHGMKQHVVMDPLCSVDAAIAQAEGAQT